jgi:hypothetical protein
LNDWDLLDVVIVDIVVLVSVVVSVVVVVLVVIDRSLACLSALLVLVLVYCYQTKTEEGRRHRGFVALERRTT